ncbi:hypothetical protein E2C01_076430 [Portunus trituberculatus]|uniref:Secreted protein n=1 Tax=Portunus trituberculatus TaxID=210409 RepID=A0A5B7III3_PORTR|nr:hypothetical protein [Portunus trituberculatus]
MHPTKARLEWPSLIFLAAAVAVAVAVPSCSSCGGFYTPCCCRRPSTSQAMHKYEWEGYTSGYITNRFTMTRPRDKAPSRSRQIRRGGKGADAYLKEREKHLATIRKKKMLI